MSDIAKINASIQWSTHWDQSDTYILKVIQTMRWWCYQTTMPTLS